MGRFWLWIKRIKSVWGVGQCGTKYHFRHSYSLLWKLSTRPCLSISFLFILLWILVEGWKLRFYTIQQNFSFVRIFAASTSFAWIALLASTFMIGISIRDSSVTGSSGTIRTGVTDAGTSMTCVLGVGASITDTSSTDTSGVVSSASSETGVT